MIPPPPNTHCNEWHQSSIHELPYATDTKQALKTPYTAVKKPSSHTITVPHSQSVPLRNITQLAACAVTLTKSSVLKSGLYLREHFHMIPQSIKHPLLSIYCPEDVGKWHIFYGDLRTLELECLVYQISLLHIHDSR